MNVFERLFGPRTAPTDASEVLADARREVLGLVEGVRSACSFPAPSEPDSATAAIEADLVRIGSDFATAARTTPGPDDPLRVVLLGRTQAGKSTLFGYLTGTDISPVGDGEQRKTRHPVYAPMAGYPDIVVVDTPGVGALDGEEDREIALSAARNADLVVWVYAKGSLQQETGVALTRVAHWGAPLLLAVNCGLDLSDDEARRQFVRYPEDTFADVDQHLERFAEYLDPLAQRLLGVLPLHADAALQAQRACPPDPDLLQESRTAALIEAIVREARRRPHRRAVAIVDTARRALVDAAEQAGAHADSLVELAETRRAGGADFDQQAQRIIDDADRQLHLDIAKRMRRFNDWTEQHYRLADRDLQHAWDKAERKFREAADQMVAAADQRLRAQLNRLGEDVDLAWGKRLDAKRGRRSRPQPDSPGLPWLRTAAKVTIEAVVSGAGMAIGASIAGPPGAVIGGLVGGIVSGLVGSLFKARRGRLAKRRKDLYGFVLGTLAEIRDQEIDPDWAGRLATVQASLDDYRAAGEAMLRRTEDLGAHTRGLAERATEAVALADAALVRTLLRLEGRDRLAAAAGRVVRRPGFASLVTVTDPAGLEEFVLWPPAPLPEEIRPVPDRPDTGALERAAYALDIGRRRGVLIPDGADGLRAALPEDGSDAFRAAEADLVGRAAGIAVHLIVLTAKPVEAAA